MSIITKQFYKCDTCQKEFPINNKRGYTNHLKEHVKDKKIIKFIKHESVVDENLLKNILENIHHYDSDYADRIKKLDFTSICTKMYIPPLDKIKYNKEIYENYAWLLTAKFVVNKIYIKKARGKFYTLIEVKIAEKTNDFIIAERAHRNSNSRYKSIVEFHSKSCIDIMKRYETTFENPFENSAYRYNLDISRIKFVTTLGNVDEENLSNLKKFYDSSYIKAKLKTNAKTKFSKNVYRVDK